MPADPRQNEENVASQRATLLRTTYTDTRQINELVPLDELLTLEDMKQHKLVPLSMTPHQITIGFSPQTQKSSLETIRAKLSGFNVDYSFISESGYKDLYNRYLLKAHPPKPVDPNELTNKLAKEVLDVKLRTENPELFSAQLADTKEADLFKLIAQQAYALGSSDIHIEPSQSGIRLRFRVDGVLHSVATLPVDRYDLLLANLQMQSGIKWNAGYAQTGSMSESLFDKDGKPISVNMRVETIPTSVGSDIVVRIFNMSIHYLNLENLGLSDDQRHHIDDLVIHPHGMLLMVGPTGSGKSSTLYAVINQLNKGDVKIVTLEDPIEYHLDGITQIPVDSEHNENFNDKLKSVLREDPDIIMIGEIRDADTAKTALQASLTGHLVLSTFHANSAAGAISRLMDMIGQNPLLASSIRLVMAQRLLRRLCEHCKEAYQPDAEVLAKIKQILEGLKNVPNLDSLQLYRAKGCKKCYHIGYLGRVSASEQLAMSPSMQQLISKGTAQTTEQVIKDAAVKDGMVTLLQDGVLKALSGITSLEEVFRVIDI